MQNLRQIFEKISERVYCESKLNNIKASLESAKWQSENLKDKKNKVSSTLNSTTSKKQNTKAELETIHTTTRSDSFLWYSYEYSSSYTTQRSNPEYAKLQSCEKELQSIEKDFDSSIERMEKVLSDLGDVASNNEKSISSLNGAIQILQLENEQLNKKIREIQKKKRIEEESLKNLMNSKRKVLQFDGDSVIYFITALNCIKKLNLRVQGTKLFFKKFSSLFHVQSTVFLENLVFIDGLENEQKMEMFSLIFESN